MKLTTLKNLLQFFLFLMVIWAIGNYKTRNMLPVEQSTTQAIIPDLNGRFVELIAPNKNQLIYFYAPWCQVCDLSIENLNYLSAVYRDLDIKIVALDYQHPDEVEAFLAGKNLQFDNLLGNDQLKQQYKVFGYPSYYYVQNGHVVDKSYGYSTAIGLIIRQTLISIKSAINGEIITEQNLSG